MVMTKQTKIKAVFFDCDGVLIHSSMWYDFHRQIGLQKEIDDRWFNDYYSGKISFNEWIQNLNKFYRNAKVTRSQMQEAMSKYQLNDNAMEIVRYLKQQNLIVAIISSGWEYYVHEVAKKLNIEIWRTNCFVTFDNNGNFVHFDEGPEDDKTKVIQIKKLCKEHNLKPEEIIFVGDSANDLEAFELTKHGVLFKTNNPEYEKVAWKKITNLKELKDIVSNTP